MNRVLKIMVCASLVLSCGAVCVGQEKKVTQTAGVDNTQMGAYRALAQLSYQAFEKGDIPAAARLARILESTWDAAEGGGGERSLGKSNKELFELIDNAMDGYIKPILAYNPVTPEKASVERAYKALLPQLNSDNMKDARAEAASMYEAFEKRELKDASKLASKFMQGWGAATADLRKANPEVWKSQYEAVIAFALPIARYHPDPPDPAAVEAAYKDFLTKLKQAD